MVTRDTCVGTISRYFQAIVAVTPRHPVVTLPSSVCKGKGKPVN